MHERTRSHAPRDLAVRATPEPIAVVGVGCRLPGGAIDLESAWTFFRDGGDAVGRPPAGRWEADRDPAGDDAAAGAFLTDVDRFDAALFGISAREARAMDPQQRLLLEAAWHALEDGGQAPDRLEGSRTGVYVGLGLVDWARRTFASAAGPSDPWSGTGVFDSVAAGRIAYQLGLAGPALAVHAACSSSLVAVHLAVRALRGGECDLALAGGVNLVLSPGPTRYFQGIGALSPTGRCRTFDARADGYVRGEGVGLLTLKRLSDARADGDRVLAVVHGSAVNHDGRTSGLTAPSGRAQQAVIRAALADAGMAPDDIGFVEAHGTGTPLGDPVEMAALAEVFAGRTRPLFVGSGKTQHGHLEAAAGVAGIVRAIGALQSGLVPPHLHLRELNARIRLDGTALHIPTAATPWPSGPRVAGVSAFGLSGTNAHVVIAAPDDTVPAARPAPPRSVLIAVSGHGPDVLQERIRQIAEALGRGQDPASVARAASDGRAVHRHRAAWIVNGSTSSDPVTAEAARDPGVVFAYTGQGAQWAGMAAGLDRGVPEFRAALDEVDATFRAITGRSLRPVLRGEDDHRAIDRTEWAQPALFAVAWGLTAMLARWGVRPHAVVGHSVGEIVAACVAGVLPLADAVRLATERGRILGALPPGGAMVAVRFPADAVTEAAASEPGIAVAAVNAPDEVVLSGEERAVTRIAAALTARGARCTPLPVSHAFHSPLVAPAAAALEPVAAGLSWTAPKLPLYSCLTGARASGEIATARFWVDHVRFPVRFADAVRAAFDDGHALFLEIGPRPALTGSGARAVPEARWIPTLRGSGDELEQMLRAVGELFVRGVRPDFRALAAGAPVGHVPPYPFRRDRHWIDPIPTAATEVAVPRYRLIRERVAAPAAAAGTDAVRVVQIGPEDRDVARALARVAARIRAPEEGKLWVHVAGADHDPLVGALRGFAATAAAELPDRFGGIVVSDPFRPEIDPTPGEEDVTVTAEGRFAVRLAPAPGPLPEAERIAPAATVLVTGGFGAFALEVCAPLLADLGARHLTLLSRRGAPAGDVRVRRALDALEARGVTVLPVAADVAERETLAAAIRRADRPLAGVIHAAGTASRVRLRDGDDTRLVEPLRAKLAGAVHLDALTRGVDSLRFFVFVSSVAGLWGSEGLAGYAAANRAMHAIALRRRDAGLPGVALAFGPLALGGIAAADLDTFARQGVRPLSTVVATRALASVLRPDSDAEVVIADVDWDRFLPILEARRSRPLLSAFRPARAVSRVTPPAHLEHAVRRELARVLGLPDDAPIDPHKGLFELGLDSALAVDLAGRLEGLLGAAVAPSVLFDHPTLTLLCAELLRSVVPSPASTRPLAARAPAEEPIAIVGMSVRLPGAPDVDAYWRLLEDGRSAVSDAPSERGIGGRGGFLPDLDHFEPDFFGMSPREARTLDPQQRLLLEVAWEAVEDAAVAPRSLEGTPTGIFVGIGRSEYWDRLRGPEGSASDDYPWSGTGNESSFGAGRLAHVFGTRGPALAVNTACSSSLVAVHLACRALRDGEATLAIAAGANAVLSAEATAWLARVGALSPTGACHTFDAAADGYVRGEGCGAVVLERLSDAVRNGRRILAVVRGSAVNHDGRASGLTVPNGTAQREVMVQALSAAGVRASDVTFVETHGTGTPLGDPIEVGAIRSVYGEGRAAPLVLGAVKPNIGHLEAAAGIAGLAKVVLALRKGTIPGIAGLRSVSPALPLDFPVVLPTAALPWPGQGPRLASVSAFAMSGTNAHVVIEAGPPDDGAGDPLPRRVWKRERMWIETGAAADDSGSPPPPPPTDLLAVVQGAASAALGRPAADPLPVRRGFFDAGMDSLSAVDLVRRLGRSLGLELPPTVPFDHPDVEALTRHVARLLGGAPRDRAVDPRRGPVADDIAIIGMACRFPDAASPEELWELLLARRVAIRDVPRERWDADAWYAPLPARPGKSYTRAGAFLADIDRFDPDFFGMSPREAETLDPQQRLALEVSVEALARAGRSGASLRGSSTGVFLGISERGWLHRFRRDGEPLYRDAWAGTGAVPSFAAGRIAHALGLRGPTLALDTTCSTSLVAVHLAANALRNQECDTALAGGVSLQLLPDDTAYLCALGALSPSGRCHVFDARADGYVRGEGAGMVVLRRRSDAERDGDPIFAVIRGSAVNHDGASAGLTVPNGAAQESVLRDALSRAGADPSDVGFLETHGTGTPLGDPVEVRAALAVYGDRADAPPLHLGALKANLGHLELAAGVASLVKAVLVLGHGLVPGHPDLETVNPHLALQGAVIPTATVPWPEGTRLAAVSAFGLSGTNAHVLLERGPAADHGDPPPVVTFRRRRIWPAEPAASTPPITYGVRWEETEAVAELPREIVLLAADRATLGDALRAAGIRVRSPEVNGPLDATLLAIGTDAATVPAGTHLVISTGAAWSCGAAAPDPEQTAMWGLARCVAVERPDIRTTIVDLGPDPTNDGMLTALRTGAPEVAIRGAPLVPRLERVAIGGAPLALSGTWIVTGGLGAIGARIAAWLAASGASRLVLVGRTAGGASAPSFPGVDVELVAADVAEEHAVAAIVARFPPDGIVHAAGITEPQSLSALDADTIRRTLAAKVQGAHHLDRLTRGRTLQGFVLISSIAATWGSRDLAAYAAANAFLDGLAEQRRAAGETATSVAFGPWAGGGMIDAARADVLERGGFMLLDPGAAIAALADALASGRPHTVVAAMAAPPRPATIAPVTRGAVLSVVVARARDVLRIPASDPLATHVPLAERGFDSLMATELKAALLSDGIDVPLGRLLGGPSPDEIAAMAVARRGEIPDAPPGPSDVWILLWTHAAVAVVAAALASAVWAIVSFY